MATSGLRVLPGRTERTIVMARVVLAASSLFAVWLDPNLDVENSLRTLRGFNRSPGYIGRYTSSYRFAYSQHLEQTITSGP